MVRPDVAAARVARASAWLNEASPLERVQREARAGVPALRLFLAKVADAAGL